MTPAAGVTDRIMRNATLIVAGALGAGISLASLAWSTAFVARVGLGLYAMPNDPETIAPHWLVVTWQGPRRLTDLLLHHLDQVVIPACYGAMAAIALAVLGELVAAVVSRAWRRHAAGHPDEEAAICAARLRLGRQ